AAFLAPEILTSPASGTPPVISSLSNGSVAGAPPLLRREGPDRESVDLVAHPLAQCPVDQLVPRDAALALERRTHDDGLVVALAVRLHAGVRVRQMLLDQ